ncbi:MAG: TQO small subunit DoxD [Actinomycetia bacterium]|nr:TQO small subunit DoxD [Actinomycetes bacterium]
MSSDAQSSDTVSVKARSGTGGGGIGLVLANDRFAQVAIVLTRITVGFLWIQNTRWKVPPDFGEEAGRGLYGLTNDAIQHKVFSPYAALVENVILPNLPFFGWIVLFTEAAIGATLLVGFATRLMGLVAVGQAGAIFLSVSQTPGEWPWAYYLMMVGGLVLAGIGAGRVLGLDAVLRPRLLASHGLWRRAVVVT